MQQDFIRRLDRLESLTGIERTALQDAVIRIFEAAARSDVLAEGEATDHCLVLFSGHACRYKLLADGGRQIAALLMPGEFCDLHSLFGRSEHAIQAISPSTFGVVAKRRLLELAGAHAAIGRALWRSTLLEGAIYSQWIVCMGRRDAHARMAHRLCETYLRCREAGLADGMRFPLPLTQSDLADALGLSHVHVNRVLQRLRRDGLIALGHGSVLILDWSGLAAAGDFDPSYLLGSSDPFERDPANRLGESVAA